MIEVKLKTETSVDPETLASHAALMCYQNDAPEMGKKIDVKTRLFDVGHHTTLQHSYFMFEIEGIAVGDVTFGLHLTHPFYNSDQRSGRYSTMFNNPDMDEIREYIKELWPELAVCNLDRVIAYVGKGIEIYQTNIAHGTTKAREFLAAERPYATQKSLDTTSKKVAQEQLRNFIPVIFPCGLDFTINLSVLAAMWRAAFTPALRVVTDKMVTEVLSAHPELAYMFNAEHRRTTDWAVPMMVKPSNASNPPVYQYRPHAHLNGITGNYLPNIPEHALLNPVDQLHFTPEMMNNRTIDISSYVELSVASMGQDQRHRTIRRGAPAFTGSFYLPPVAAAIGMAPLADQYFKDWVELMPLLPPTLHAMLAPYGAMVGYEKRGDLNAVAHEQIKRLCLCAQEEVSEISRQLREQIARDKTWRENGITGLFEPPCYSTGKCAEGSRYCGRDLSIRKSEDTDAYFPERKV
jgi:hypothetical protein